MAGYCCAGKCVLLRHQPIRFAAGSAIEIAFAEDIFTATVVVPEPGTLTLLEMSAIGLLACGWRRRRTS